MRPELLSALRSPTVKPLWPIQLFDLLTLGETRVSGGGKSEKLRDLCHVELPFGLSSVVCLSECVQPEAIDTKGLEDWDGGLALR